MAEGRSWVDIEGRRFFSSAFYADLLHFLGVSLVIALDDIADRDPHPASSVAGSCRRVFAEHGVELLTLEELAPGSGCGRLSFQALDRFIALADAAAGPIGVTTRCHCSAGASEAHTLLTAYLLRRKLLPGPAEAVAWLRIARPPRRPATTAHLTGPGSSDRPCRLPRRSASFTGDLCPPKDE